MPTPPTRLQPPVDTARDHISGPVDARVTLLEYSDYQCGYCRRAHDGIMELRDERLPGQLRYVFRHFPNERLHPQAQFAAEAAEAAAAQDRFWNMHEYLLAHQDALDRDSLVAGARELGLDSELFARELDDHTHAPRVNEDFKSAEQSGAAATLFSSTTVATMAPGIRSRCWRRSSGHCCGTRNSPSPWAGTHWACRCTNGLTTA